MLDSILNTTHITLGPVLICLFGALALGLLTGLFYSRRGACSRSLAVTLALLPPVSAAVILVVNGNLGAGIAVAGAFSLVRFRSAQGSAHDILAVFLSMAVGLCCGAGYVVLAALAAVLVLGTELVLGWLRFGEEKHTERTLKITVPEALDYEGLFDDLLQANTRRYSLESVRTAEMGSVYRLEYRVTLDGPTVKRAFLDALRTRNGNLEISCTRVAEKHEVM